MKDWIREMIKKKLELLEDVNKYGIYSSINYNLGYLDALHDIKRKLEENEN